MDTSLAQFYFPVWHVTVASACAHAQSVARVVEQFPELNPTHEMLVLSMGAGDVKVNINMDGNPNADWGLQQWGSVSE